MSPRNIQAVLTDCNPAYYPSFLHFKAVWAPYKFRKFMTGCTENSTQLMYCGFAWRSFFLLLFFFQNFAMHVKARQEWMIEATQEEILYQRQWHIMGGIEGTYPLEYWGDFPPSGKMRESPPPPGNLKECLLLVKINKILDNYLPYTLSCKSCFAILWKLRK